MCFFLICFWGSAGISTLEKKQYNNAVIFLGDELFTDTHAEA